MAACRLSKRAVEDLIDIDRYTLETWGERQVDIYESALRGCFTRIANTPHLGRSSEEFGRGLRRIEQGSHVIFYRIVDGGILISRILHRRMRPEKSRFSN